MSVIYNLPAYDVLDIFGNIPKKKYANEKLKLIEEKYNIILPDMFKRFMCSANDILETADVWDYSKEQPFYFLYEYISTNISEYLLLVESPVSEWKNIVDDYLIIGSDYAGGIVYFGIKKTDLNMENPPVYMHHEANNINEWNILYNSLSEYFSAVVCDAVLCECYHTARRVLEKYGWNYAINSKEVISRYGIVINNLQKFSSMYRTGDNDWISWCYVPEEKVLFIFRSQNDNMIIRGITYVKSES